MAALAGILNHHAAASSSLTGGIASPMAGPGSTTSTSSTTSSSSASSASSSSATITANDFLTLLVTEMKNQDPTSNTDPNEYINQLVQVNSLEQLIDVNQNLVTGLGISSSSSSSSAAGSGVASDVTGQGSSHGYAAAQKTSGLAASQLSSVGVNATDNTAAATAAAFKRAPGSLSIPEANASAQRVAHSLNGQ